MSNRQHRRIIVNMLLSRYSEAATLTNVAILQRTPRASCFGILRVPLTLVYLRQEKVSKRSGAIEELIEELMEDDQLDDLINT